MKKRGLKSIRLEMVLYISLLSIAICAVFYAASTTLSKSAISNMMEDSLTQITRQVSKLIAERVDSHYGDLDSLAAETAFSNPSVNKFQIQTLLAKEQSAQGYVNLMFAGTNGAAYTGAGKAYDVAGDVNFIHSLAGEDYASDPVPVEGSDAMTMTYSVPVKGSDGTVQGVLMLVTDGYELCDIISDITFAKTGYAWVINAEGVFVGHPDRTLVYTQDPALEKAKSDSSQTGFADLMTEMVAGASGVGGYTYKGVVKYAGYAPIEGAGWYMALTAPHSEVFAETDQLQMILLIAALLLALLSAGAALIIANRIHRPIVSMMKVAERFSVGDLDVEIDVHENNEIGVLAQAFQNVSVNMSNAIRGIRAATQQVSEGSRQVSDSAMQLAQGATQQASALEELSASVEEIASQTRMNAANANEASGAVDNTRTLAERGNEKMGDMLKAMESIDQSSADINRIIKVIDDIAFQTNILALNAAVEAARAGQHGKGFAVVAEEVRNLAAKSASAAKETSALIENSSRNVAGGTKLARETAGALKGIVEEINRVTSLVQGITTASGEQSTGIDQINQGLQQISQVVQANSSTSQQSAAASKELTAQAVALTEQVASFKLKEEGPPAQKATREAEINPDVLHVLDTMKHRKESGLERLSMPGKAPGPSKRDAPIPSSVRAAAKAVVNAAFEKPVKISLGEEEDAPPAHPIRISLGEEETESAAPPAKVTLSDREFGKY